VIEHDESCPPALFGRWLTEAGCTLEVGRPYLGEALPSLPSYDAVLVLGGEMGANDDGAHPWLGPLKQGIGWTPAASGDGWVAASRGAERAIHWDRDVVVDLPPGAEVLAVSPGGEVQVARFAPWVPLGTERDVVLAEITAAAAELEAHWRPLAVRFAEVAGR